MTMAIFDAINKTLDAEINKMNEATTLSTPPGPNPDLDDLNRFRDKFAPSSERLEQAKAAHKAKLTELFSEEIKRVDVTRRPTAPKHNVQENKPRASLIPLDVLIKHLTPAYEEGCIKYQRESWRGGFPVSVMIDAAQRHISEFFYEGHDYDPDPETLRHGIKKHHLAGAIFSLLSILHTLDTRPELDDRPHKLPPPAWPEPTEPTTHYRPEDD